MTTPADTHRTAGPFSPNFNEADHPSLNISDYDALADLFLGEPETGTPMADGDIDADDDAPVHSFAAAPALPTMPTNPEPSYPTVEAVIVGHLPVRAHLWVMQHARHTADELNQTVAVVRTFGDEIAIDLLSPTTAKRNFNTVDARSLDDALATAASAATHWIVTTDELSEPDLLADRSFDTVSLLTSAARTATIAAYRTLKQTMAQTEPVEGQSIRFVVLGSDAEDAARAATQLRSVAGAFMDTDIDVVIGPKQIDASRAVPIYRGRLSEDSPSITGLIERGQHLATDKPSTERTVKASREQSPVAIEAKPEASTDGLRLSTMLDGLTDLPLNCPIEPRVQLALDAAGRIHLLATCHESDAVRSLTQAAAWAALNRDLILAAAQRPDAEPAEPVMHLLVGDVPTNRRLLDAPIRVHLLRAVPVQNAEPVWFSTPLN